MSSSQICILLAIIIYLAAMLYIGFRVAKGNSTSSDFYLGGRKLGPLVTAMSAEASDMSSYLLMGLPGLAYLSGTADVGWTIVGLAAGTYLNWLITAKRLRRYTEITGSFTLPEFFSARWHDSRNVLTAIAAVMIVIFFIPYTASGFSACGKLFSSLFGMEYHTAMIISAFVIIAYTTAGGFMAASLTDFIQSIIMTAAIVSILIFAVSSAGGWSAVMANAESLPGYLSLTETYNGTSASSYGFLKIISTVAWGLGYFGMPHILLRFMAIEDEDKLKLSRRVASVWVVIAMAIAVGIGIAGRAMTGRGLIALLSGSDSETIIIHIADLLSRHGIAAALLAGVVMAGILASTMSTADSQLLAASSSVSQNLLQDCLHLHISEKSEMLAARITVLIIAALGIVIAWNPDSSIFGIVSFAWAGFGAVFGPVVLLALFWRRSTFPGAAAGMLAGGVMVFAWKYLVRPLGGAFDIYELLPAFLSALVINVIVSLCSKAPDEYVLAEFDKAASGRKLHH